MTNTESKLAGISAKKLASYFEYLDALRDSGITNMFGAAPYVMQAFKLNRDKASAVVGAWMRTFGKTEDAKLRAEKAISEIAA
jgi:hypothetical protein